MFRASLFYYFNSSPKKIWFWRHPTNSSLSASTLNFSDVAPFLLMKYHGAPRISVIFSRGAQYIDNPVHGLSSWAHICQLHFFSLPLPCPSPFASSSREKQALWGVFVVKNFFVLVVSSNGIQYGMLQQTQICLLYGSSAFDGIVFVFHHRSQYERALSNMYDTSLLKHLAASALARQWHPILVGSAGQQTGTRVCSNMARKQTNMVLQPFLLLPMTFINRSDA